MKSGRVTLLLLLFGILVFGLYPAAQAATVYVDGVNGNDSNNGSAWDIAKKTIGAGVNAALAGDTVLVAKATYKLSAPITVNKNLTIRSQAGYTQTIIDGNLAVNHCFYLYPYTQIIQVIIEGFTIRNGNAAGVTFPEYNGGGICIDLGARATIRDCYVTKNSANGHGGGVFFGTTGNVLENSYLVENSAKGGGAVAGNNVTVRSCTVTGNTATGDAFLDGGGGISSTNYGGLVENSTFSANTAKAGGGGVFFNVGGVYLTGGGLIRNCTISGNSSAGFGGGVYIHTSGTVESSTIQNNTGDRGGGVGLGFQYAVARNCTISGNRATGNFGEGGGVYLSAGGTAERCLIRDNRARVGGGVYFTGGSQGLLQISGQILSSLLLANTAQERGGAAYFSHGGYLLNCTVTGNVVVAPGVTLFFENGNPVGAVRNFIVWANTASQGPVGGSPSTITYDITYSLVWGWTGSGEGNLATNTNPLFAGPADYRLQKDSPCKNKGSNSAPGLTTRDLADWPRIIEGVVDMGAYEYGTVAAEFTGSHLKGPFPLSVLFNATTWGTVTGYQWTFGDGGKSPEPNPAHLYPTPGRYTVSLTVIGTETSETVLRTDYIEVLEKRPIFLPLLMK